MSLDLITSANINESLDKVYSNTLKDVFGSIFKVLDEDINHARPRHGDQSLVDLRIIEKNITDHILEDNHSFIKPAILPSQTKESSDSNQGKFDQYYTFFFR